MVRSGGPALRTCARPTSARTTAISSSTAATMRKASHGSSPAATRPYAAEISSRIRARKARTPAPTNIPAPVATALHVGLDLRLGERHLGAHDGRQVVRGVGHQLAERALGGGSMESRTAVVRSAPADSWLLTLAVLPQWGLPRAYGLSRFRARTRPGRRRRRRPADSSSSILPVHPFSRRRSTTPPGPPPAATPQHAQLDVVVARASSGPKASSPTSRLTVKPMPPSSARPGDVPPGEVGVQLGPGEPRGQVRAAEDADQLADDQRDHDAQATRSLTASPKPPPTRVTPAAKQGEDRHGDPGGQRPDRVLQALGRASPPRPRGGAPER